MPLPSRPCVVPASGCTPARVRLAAAAATLALLAACGGGGGSATAEPPVVPAALQLHGVAAVGKAWGGAAVEARCSSGTGAATTQADGSFSLKVADGSLPCVLRATLGSAVLHSVANGSGATATANISPLTDLVLAQAAGAETATVYAGFDAAMRARLTPSALTAATASLNTALGGVVSLDGVNPFTDPLVAATATAAGNALDSKLDTLGAKLAAAQLSLAELRAALVRNAAAAPAVLAVQLKPAAAHCASLRSGPYIIIDPNESDPQARLRKVSLDAVALTVRRVDGTADAPVVPVDGKPCHFTTNNGQEHVVVSAAGVLVTVNLAQDGSNARRVAIGLPVQAISASELAGTWNMVELARTNGPTAPATNYYGNVLVDAAGKLSRISDCDYLLPCVPGNGTPSGFTAHADGGFSIVETSGDVDRFFAYRAISGDLMLVGLMPSGIMVGTRQAELALPVLGETLTYWDVTIGSNFAATDLIGDVRTISAVDAAAGTYSRSPSYTGITDSIRINTPRPGMRVRESCTSSTGAVTACGLISLPLPGMGITVHGASSALANGGFLDIAVLRPAGSTAKGVQASGGNGVAALPGTLVVAGGETYPLRASMTVSGAGQITGGQYDFHKLDGTMTPCEHSAANSAVCHGTNAVFSATAQGGPVTTAGSSSAIQLVAGPDIFGYTYTGTLLGVRWSGTWAKVAAGNSTLTGSGSFSVDLVITQP